jgi:hypothetical protein
VSIDFINLPKIATKLTFDLMMFTLSIDVKNIDRDNKTLNVNEKSQCFLIGRMFWYTNICIISLSALVGGKNI